MRLREARILLTGATGGIGQALGAALRKGDAAVMATGRASASPLPPDVAWVSADLDEPRDIARLAADAAAWGANVVVHGAGVPAFGPLMAMRSAQMDQVLATNLLAPMRLTQALLPHLCRQPAAQVVFVGSALGRIGLPGFSVYGASKAGLHGFAEALRRELADSPVRVQLLAPRSTRTGFNGAAVEAYNRATGTTMDAPEAVAAALLALIESGRPEHFVGGPERVGVRLNGLLGPRFDGVFKRHRMALRALPPASSMVAPTRTAPGAAAPRPSPSGPAAPRPSPGGPAAPRPSPGGAATFHRAPGALPHEGPST
jgi:short-subunit dehydrogenase